MIIGTKVFDMKILQYIDDYEGLVNYVRSLVPERYRHLNSIVNNTRYYLNIQLLQARNISKENKEKLSFMLMHRVKVVGFIDCFITCGELERRINMKAVMGDYNE